MPAAKKRKKTADMPDSPPKRVTRSNAKASNEPALSTRKVKVMTPSAKATTQKEKPVDKTKSAKKTTRADYEQLTEAVEPQLVEKPVKTRTRAKRSEENVVEPERMADLPGKAQGRQKEHIEADEPKPTGRKTRGRPKKAEDPPDSEFPLAYESERLDSARKTTRNRIASLKTKETMKAPAKTANAKSATLKKKVTFKDPANRDKENAPIDTEKADTKATGLRAKPIRRAATTRATTRSKKSTSVKSQSETEPSESRAQPLSPKKVIQVAKSSSVGSEDELCGSKTPVRALSQSPMKPLPSSARCFGGPVSKLDSSTVVAQVSPSKPAAQSVLQSPARRRPLSPFKNSMKTSPRKINLGVATPFSLDPFQQSAPKGTLQDSPKRGHVSTSFTQSVLISNTRMKTPLLQSPARRPERSPAKASFVQSPTKWDVAKPPAELAALPNRSESSVRLDRSPQKAIGSPVRTMRAQVVPVKVQEGTQADCVPNLETVSVGSVHQEKPDVLGERGDPCRNESGRQDVEDDAQHPKTQDRARTPMPSPIKENGHSDLMSNLAQESVTAKVDILPQYRSTTPPGPIPIAASAFSLASPAFRATFDESDSEDELSSPQKSFQRTPSKKQGILIHDLGSSAANTSAALRRSSIRSATNRKSLAMTPLAVQMSTWLASSPEKKDLSESAQIEQPALSPSNPSFQESPAKPSFFEDQIALCVGDNDTIVDVQMADVENDQIKTDLVAAETNQESYSFEEYGDENLVPVVSQLMALPEAPPEQTLTCTPAKVFFGQPKEIHTVSKVPLRPAGEESPLKPPRKRSRSLAGLPASGKGLRASSAPAMVAELTENQCAPLKGQKQSKPISPMQARSSNDDSLIETPRALRKEGSSSVLRGVIAYVDVHTSEGEDASGIFLELLTQMGARCVKQWSWNARSSMAGLADEEYSTGESGVSTGKVGITHVVFKDGGKRTMEKVRESRGVVSCVGVGWVLEYVQAVFN